MTQNAFSMEGNSGYTAPQTLHERIPHISFSTDSYPKGCNFEAWQEEVVKRYLNHDLSVLPGDTAPFFMRATSFFLGEIRLSSFEGSATRVVRSHRHVADNNDDFVYRINRHGPMHLSHNSPLGGRETRSVSLRHSAGVLASNGRTGEAVYGAPHRYVQLYSIGIPRKSLCGHVRHVDAYQLQDPGRASPLLRALTQYVDVFLAGQLAAPQTSAHDIGNHLLDLVSMVLGPTQEAREVANRRGLRAARLASILRYIQHTFLLGDLKIAHIAHYLGTTERYVQLLLEESGTTFSDVVLQSRLQAAREKLLDSTMRSLPISVVAAQCGFNDVSYFNRVFKRQFEKTPREFRMATPLG